MLFHLTFQVSPNLKKTIFNSIFSRPNSLIMKRFIAFLLICLPLFSFVETKSWVYLNPTAVADLKPYDEALAKADLDRYRYFDKRTVLHFENGLDVELLFANELTAIGIPVKTDRVRTAEPSFDTKPIFRLSPNGVILEIQTRTKVK